MAIHLPTPETMRAWVRSRRGPACAVLELAKEMPVPPGPVPSSRDVLIRVSHVSLQYTSEMAMKLLPTLPFTGMWTPEIELSGQVVASGAGAPAEVREPGTHVVAFRTAPWSIILGNGVLAEYVLISGSQVVRVNETLDMASASGIPCSGSVALDMVRAAGVRHGQRVLINGASGSIGSLLVQLCKLRGATVVGIASGGNESMVRGFGADEFIDYRKCESLPSHLALIYGQRPFDTVLDCAGVQALFANSADYLKPDGVFINVGALQGLLITVGNWLYNRWMPICLGGAPRRFVMFSSPPSRESAIYIAHLIDQRKLRLPVDSVYPMEKATDAYERIATKRARGKVVIKVCKD
ncbi:hypothetical protein ANO11243_034620 [Dothideomycetidae sp. 11243]|nr:hypothetical protein ANO11243_034620 [fungal sp. No.11243]